MKDQLPCVTFKLGSVFAEVFKVMPLAAVVAQTTLVLHGGLWRKPAEKKRKAGAAGRRAAAKCAKRNQQGAASVSGSGDPDWMPSTGSGSNKITLGTLKCALASSHLVLCATRI